MSVHLDKPTVPLTVCEVGWARQGRTFRREVTREAYLRDLAYADDLAFPVYRKGVTDRQGRLMVVVWITTGENGSLLSAYEITGRA
jgi:hypothetical protein